MFQRTRRLTSGPSLSSALEKPSAEDDKHEAEDNAQTIRPNRSPGPNIIPLAQPPASDIAPIVEDYSDLATEEDEEWLQEKVADFKVSIGMLKCKAGGTNFMNDCR